GSARCAAEPALRAREWPRRPTRRAPSALETWGRRARLDAPPPRPRDRPRRATPRSAAHLRCDRAPLPSCPAARPVRPRTRAAPGPCPGARCGPARAGAHRRTGRTWSTSCRSSPRARPCAGKLLPDDGCPLDERRELLLHDPARRLPESTIRIEPELLGRDVLEQRADALRDVGRRLGLERLDVD